jgi:acyl-CoA dehydrogenase
MRWRANAESGPERPTSTSRRGFAHDAVVIEEQKRICDSAFPYVPGSVNIPHFLLESATHEQLLEWMPPIVRGEKIVSVAITEPDAGSDVKTLRTSARSEGDHYVINGSKIFITLGHVSDWCMVAARTGGEGPKGISLIMVDTRHTPGFKVGRILDKVGQHGLDTCELFFEDMRVPKSNLIGGVEGTGFGQLMNVFVRERLAIATTGVAVAESAVRLAIDYAKQRKMFGKTLWDFQNTRFKMVECETQTRFARCVLDSLIDRASMGQHVDPNEAARAKWYCSDLECRVVDECVQLLGGYGYMDEYPIAQLYMDARVERIYGGSNETLKELIARSL